MNKAITDSIAAVYPEWKVDRSMLVLWNAILAGCTDGEILTAVIAHARESAFPPRPADLLAIIRAGRGESAMSALRACIEHRRERQARLAAHRRNLENEHRHEFEPEPLPEVEPLPSTLAELAELAWGPNWLDRPTDGREHARFLDLHDRLARETRAAQNIEHARQVIARGDGPLSLLRGSGGPKE